ncbi:MAG: MFS transporter [Janthinobacterium lividum]
MSKKFVSLGSAEFSFALFSYGIDAILVLYLTQVFHLTTFEAFSSLSIKGCLIYSLPILIAFLSQRLISREMMISMGLLWMAFGFLLFNYSDQKLLAPALSFIIVGYVLGRPALPLLLGKVMDQDQNTRAMRLFYAISNLAYILAPFIFSLSLTQEKNNFFLILSFFIFVIFLIFTYIFYSETLFASWTKYYTGIGAIIVLTALVYGLVCFPDNLKYLFFIAIGTAGFYIHRLYKHATPASRPKVNQFCATLGVACLFFIVFSQQYFFMPLYIEKYVDASILGFKILTPWFSMINPILSVILASLMSRFIDHRESFKIIGPFAFLMTGIGFLCLAGGAAWTSMQTMSILAAYFCLVLAELALVPFVQSLISTWPHEKDRSTLIGLLYLSMAFSKIIAPYLAVQVDYRGVGTLAHALEFYTTLFCWTGVGIVVISGMLKYFIKYLFVSDN